MKRILLICLLSMHALASAEDSHPTLNFDEILKTSHKAAARFDYYDEISAAAANLISSNNEIGGQCGDYALAFANIWNAKHEEKALLVIQQQGLKAFPDGLYEVLGKDGRNLPFLKNRTTSMLYTWNNVLGIGHPVLGGYTLRLVKKLHIKSHFNLRNWQNNGPHVWVRIGNISVDPTYADLGGLPTIGTDRF